MYRLWLPAVTVCCFMLAAEAFADVTMPAIFGDHMVLQQGQADRLWGWAEPSEKVTVEIAGQCHSAIAGQDGRWSVTLDPLPAGGPHIPRIALFGGGLPIRVGDRVVGGIGVSGGTVEQDIACAQAGLAALAAA